MDLRYVRTLGACVLAILSFFWLRPLAAQEEVKLAGSITVLPDHPSGIEMISKWWEHESGDLARSNRFVVTLFTKATDTGERSSYYERVRSFEGDKPSEFSIWMNASECSFFQTMVFRIQSQGGPKLVVGTAARIPSETIGNADPLPQHIRIYVPKIATDEEGDTGRSPMWFDSAVEAVTDQSFCEVEKVRNAIRLFVRKHMRELMQ